MTTTHQLRFMQLLFAGIAAIAMVTFVDAAHADASAATFGHLRLTDTASDWPSPQSPPGLGGGGFAADDGDDQAQQQEQQALQQMQQAEQQAEQQNEAAQQQAQQAEQQGQWVEEHPGP